MADTRTDPAAEIVKQMYGAEYCIPGGISINECMEGLRVPPLTTSLRFNQMSSCSSEIALPDDQERMIRKSLLETNRNRFTDSEKLAVDLRAAGGISDTWICSFGGDLGARKNSVFAMEEKHPEDGDLLVIVDVLAGESCLRGADLYVPGIIACSGNIRRRDRVDVYCDVDAKCLHGRMSGFAELKMCYVGSGIAQVSREELFATKVRTSGVGVVIDNRRYPLPSLSEFLALHPALVAQNIPSCVAVQVLNPQPGETVLDCCAAPGGKTLHIASLMRGTGRVIAIEKSAKRAAALSATVNKLYSNIEVSCADASKLSERKELLIPYVYDRILIDTPCSGSGNRPRLSFKSLSINQLKSCQRIQKSIVKSVVPLLKPGGRLVYSTCSVFARENEDLVSWMLKEFPELHLVEQSPYLGRSGFIGEGLTKDSAALLQRFDIVPSISRIDSIGFFIALFEKK